MQSWRVEGFAPRSETRSSLVVYLSIQSRSSACNLGTAWSHRKNCKSPRRSRAGSSLLHVLWRKRDDAKGRIASWVTRRCPLFCDEVGVTPDSALHLDTLHTLFQGPMATFVYEVLQECLDQDLYGIGGPKDSREERTLERLVND